MAERVSRGEIWLLALPRPDKRRPVLVLTRPSLIEVQKALAQIDDCPGGCHCADDCGIHCPITVSTF